MVSIRPEVGMAVMVLTAAVSMWMTRIPPEQTSIECASGRGDAFKGPHALKTLTVATYNTEWLFDGENDANTPRRNAIEANAHVDEIAGAIASTQADVVTLSEIEGCFMLYKLLQRKSLSSSGYIPYVIDGSDSGTRQQVGLLTKIATSSPLLRSEERIPFPLPDSKCGYKGRSGKVETSGVSKHYFTVLNVTGLGEILLVGAHLKAQPNDPVRCANREAQATVLANIVKAHALTGERKRHVIVMGDFNDFDGQVLDVSDNIPNSRVLQILSTDLGLVSVASHETLPKDQRFTWTDKPATVTLSPRRYQPSMLDHMLVSPGLFNRIQSVRILHHTHASDHFPLVVTFGVANNV